MNYKGIKLDIKGSGYDFLMQETTDNNCTTQNVIVTLGSTKNSDIVFPEKGTDLSLFFIGKNYVSLTRTQHAANFAALDALNFYKQFNNEKSVLTGIKIDAGSLFLNSPNLKVDVIISDNPSSYRRI